jgi:YVTN family beta-propeller protein
MDREIYQRLTLLLCIVCMAACRKDKPDPVLAHLPGAGGNVYIVCEGNRGSGQASLYAYQPLADSVFGDLYRTANNLPLGDVFQSMQRMGDKLLLCVVNSDKVVILDAATWRQVAAVSVSMPRYILPLSSTRAYVSSEFNNKVYVIDPQSYRVTDTIVLPFHNTEGMCTLGGYAYICCWDTACAALYKVDVATNKLAQTLPIPGRAPQEVLIDKDQMLWILAGDQPYGTTASLIRMDPSNGSILMTYNFPATADPLKPVFNSTKDTLYFLEAYNTGKQVNGVYRMSIHASALPDQAFIPQHTNQYYWALGVDPADNTIYVADAKDFNQKATVYTYGPDGTAKHNFYVGPGPGHFYYDY